MCNVNFNEGIGGMLKFNFWGICNSDNGNSKIKDMHLLKSFQRLLREDDVEVKSLMEILSEVKTQAMINQGFKMLIQKCKQVNVLIGTVDEYLRKYCDDG